MINGRNILLAIISAVILGVLIYVPVIPHSTPILFVGVAGCLGSCPPSLVNPPPMVSHSLDSITLQFLNFGGGFSGSLARGDYAFCSFGPCVGFWLGELYAVVIAIMAIDAVLIARYLSKPNGVRGASTQIGLGALAILFTPLLQYLNSFAASVPFWNSPLIPDEIVVLGTVLILTGVAELWWFRATKDYTQKAEELATVIQS